MNKEMTGRTAAGRWTVALAAGTILLPAAALAQAPTSGAEPFQPDLAATVLLMIGVMLLILEVKIVSYGILGVMGTVCLAVATGVIWRYGQEFWGISIYYVLPIILLVLILTVAMAIMAAKAHREQVASGAEGFIGEVAEASEDLKPAGRVFFQGSYWQAESCAPVSAGAPVRILAVERLKLIVEPLSPSAGISPACLSEVNTGD